MTDDDPVLGENHEKSEHHDKNFAPSTSYAHNIVDQHLHRKKAAFVSDHEETSKYISNMDPNVNLNKIMASAPEKTSKHHFDTEKTGNHLLPETGEALEKSRVK